MLKLLAFLALLSSTYAMVVTQSDFPYNDCGGSTLGKLVTANISVPCDSLQCTIQRGTAVTFFIAFNTVTTSDIPKFRVTLSLGGVPNNPPLTNDQMDVCKGLVGASCPIKTGIDYLTRFDFTTDQSVTAAKHTIRVEIYEPQSEKNFACLTFSALITCVTATAIA